MPASRVESESKPEPKRWESDDYKADLSAKPDEINPEIKELCPIVITTIAAAPTQNKDADGNVIYEFDRTQAESDPNNDKAHFFTDVGVARKGGGWFSHNVFEGTDVKGLGIRDQIDAVAKERGATHCMLYVHGYTVQAQGQIEAAMAINAKWLREGAKAFCVPVIWPFERPSNWSPRRILDLAGYGTQKAGADGAARGLREEILPYLQHEIDKDGLKSDGTNVSISIMCHSMGNYVLKKMAPETESAFQFDNIFMVAADVRATTFDEVKGVDETGDHDGKDIARLAKHKIHVCWYSLDLALLGRRLPIFVENGGRAALGRRGLKSKYMEQLIEPKGKFIDHEWDKDGPKFPMGLSGHNYQTQKEALKYYLDQMRANSDKP